MTTSRSTYDTRDQQEHAEVSAILGGLPPDHPVRAAYKGRLPVWPCLNEAGLRNFVIPEWVTELHIFSDNDAPLEGKKKGIGQAASAALLCRAVKQGFALGARRSAPMRVFLHVPKVEDTDFLDEWVACQARRAA